MNRLRIYLLLVSLTAGGCGEEADKSTLSGFPASGVDPTPTSETPDAEEPTDQELKPCTGLSNCSPPAGTMISFKQPVSFGLTACAVSKARIVVSQSGYVALLRANCQGSHALYSVKLSLSGEAVGNPILISTACDERVVSVDKFSVDSGSASVMAAYTCNASTTSVVKNMHLSLLDFDGKLLVERANVRAGVPSGFMVRWHDSSAQYAVAGPTWLQRYTPSGQDVGGAVVIPQVNYLVEDIADLRVSSSSWQVIKGSSYSPLSCSKVTSSGQLTCLNQKLNAYNTAQASGILVSSNYSNALTRSLFSPETCTDTKTSEVGSGSEIDARKVYGSVMLPGNFHAVLVATARQTLSVAVFHRDATAVAVMNPVANANMPTEAQFGVSPDGNLYAAWVESNLVKLALGTVQ